MPNNNQNNGNNNKNKRGKYKSLLQSFFNDDLNQELRQLIDLAVRKQFNPQQFVERLTNTHYFHQQFPGLIEKNGSIANALTGENGQGVNANNLASAIRNYKTGLESYKQIAQNAGYQLDKQQYASALKADVSGKEFAARIQAIDTVDSNPGLLDAFKLQAQRQGLKADHMAAYKAALHAGDKRFQDIYEAASYQYNLQLSAGQAEELAQGKGGAVGGSDIRSIDQVIAAARQNLQAIGPELAAQGITTPQLVKVLNNPTAFAPEMDKIQQALESRKMFSRPVPGTYPQQGPAGLAQYPQRGQAAYG